MIVRALRVATLVKYLVYRVCDIETWFCLMTCFDGLLANTNRSLSSLTIV